MRLGSHPPPLRKIPRLGNAFRCKAEGARKGRRGTPFRSRGAYGKHVFHHWSGGLVVHVHLGMAGWFYLHRGKAPEPRPTVRMRLATHEVVTDLIGPPPAS